MRTGYCSECGNYVNLDPDGGCVNGHPATSVMNVIDVPDERSTAVPSTSGTTPTQSVTQLPLYKRKWFQIVGLLAAGFLLGVIFQSPRVTAGFNAQKRNDELTAKMATIVKERDSLKAELDPIRRAEEASAAADAAAAKAVAQAQAAAAANAQAEADAAARASADAQAQADAAAAAKAAEQAANTFTDGVYLVGEDIKPGTYRGTVTDDIGYWARLRDTSGGLSSIIANGLPKGPFVLTIKKSDKAVELKGVSLVRK